MLVHLCIILIHGVLYWANWVFLPSGYIQISRFLSSKTITCGNIYDTLSLENAANCREKSKLTGSCEKRSHFCSVKMPPEIWNDQCCISKGPIINKRKITTYKTYFLFALMGTIPHRSNQTFSQSSQLAKMELSSMVLLSSIWVVSRFHNNHQICLETYH